MIFCSKLADIICRQRVQISKFLNNCHYYICLYYTTIDQQKYRLYKMFSKNKPNDKKGTACSKRKYQVINYVQSAKNDRLMDYVVKTVSF